MLSDLGLNRAAGRRLAVAILAVALCVGPSAWGGIDGRQVIVTVEMSANTTSVQAQIVQAASFGADGAAVVVRNATSETRALIGDLSTCAAQHKTKLWIAVQLPDNGVLDIARALAALPVEGFALLFAPPQGEATAPDNQSELLAIKRQGDKLGQEIRQVKRALGARQKLALCTAASEIAPETARGRFVPVADLVRDGTVDVVALSAAERWNFHRLRLLRDAPLQAGQFLDADASEEQRRVGLLSRAAVDAVQNETCQMLWLRHFPVETASQIASAAIAGFKQSQYRRTAIDAALAKGTLVVDQEVSEKACNDQASLHGVAQSFTPSRDGLCPMVQVYAAIRGVRESLPPPMHVELRSDEQGRPGSAVLAKTDIPATEFAAEPAYRWGGAQFDLPVPLKKGQTYWIYLTNKSHPDGNYVWRIVKNAASPRGHAWSKLYDYAKNAWVFRVYLKQEPAK